MSSIVSTVLSLVLFVTYIGIGALAHDTHFSLAWAIAEHRAGMGGTGADHPDHDTRIRRWHSAVGGRGHRERDPAVSDGCCRAADDAQPRDQAAASHPDRAFHRGDALGRMLPFSAACAAGAAGRLRARAWLRPACNRPLRDRDRLSARGQSHADLCLRDPAADTARLPVLDREQFQGTRRYPRPGARPCVLSGGRAARQRPRHPHQRRGGRHDRLPGPQMADQPGEIS